MLQVSQTFRGLPQVASQYLRFLVPTPSLIYSLLQLWVKQQICSALGDAQKGWLLSDKVLNLPLFFLPEGEKVPPTWCAMNPDRL